MRCTNTGSTCAASPSRHRRLERKSSRRWIDRRGRNPTQSFASLEESVGDVRLRQFAKCMLQLCFRDVECAEAVGFSHGQFDFVVDAFDHTAGEPLPGAEIV